MYTNIAKLCADSLRKIVKDTYDTKLKASHAHELTAAYFGYKSKNAMLADTQYPIENLNEANVFVMIPEEQIDRRRNQLSELPSALPDSYTLGKAIYTPLFSDEFWTSPLPPFRSFKTCVKYLLEDHDGYQHIFRYYLEIPLQHIVDVDESEDSVKLTVNHLHEVSKDEVYKVGQSTITLSRIAGRIGFSSPQIHPEIWTGGARKLVSSLEVQS